MSFEDNYLGCPCGVSELRALSDKLSAKVLEKVNNTQELVMINDFAKDANEYLFRKCLQDRISDIYSWRWVLEDLSKRLDDAICSLNYELKALKVVGQRVQKEIDDHCMGRTKPAALCPLSDTVEEAIVQEYEFLKQQKKNFQDLVITLEKQIEILTKTKTRISKDILIKSQTIAIEESCANRNMANVDIKVECNINTKRNKGSPPKCWENRCSALKRDGLRALCRAVVARQQVRGARIKLSITSEAFMAKVDAALKRRIHANKSKYAELEWQKEEAENDLRVLEVEMLNTEQSLIQNMEQERVVRARLADRTTRPPGELLKDEININLKNELIRIKQFVRDLRKNIESISTLQDKLKNSIVQIECAQRDLVQIIILDEDRQAARQGHDIKNTVVDNSNLVVSGTPNTFIPDFPTTGMEPVCTAADLPPEVRCNVLLPITEEDEEENDNEDQNCGSYCLTNNVPGYDYDDVDDEGLDDYPFDY
ncbi:tektin-B1-like [Hyposmocoma kahamanoa]|uniref:tektin-B1-like n=1 Tax=Hyposmocoma kahamanoa TaxID=1477025 RepID=UPI000E6D7119|nr:tektin-B1-like [Hyposmocoma kahamanoa]